MEPSELRGCSAGWQTLHSAIAFENEICRLRDDLVRLPNGSETTYAYLARAEAVIVVPITNDGSIVLLKQYRYPVREWCYEVPAGGTHDSGSKALEDVARKELEEEIGATAKKMSYVTFFYSANAFSDEKCHVFLAEGVELTKNPDREEGEAIKMEVVPIAKALSLARGGEMKTGPCALAVLLCERMLLEAGTRNLTGVNRGVG